MKVSICIPTFGRPESLRRLLASLQGLEFRESPEPSVEVIVVDNDAVGSARDACSTLAGSQRWPVVYDIEPAPGVTHARNRAVGLASSDSDFIAMIDDDEVPERDWLERLLLTQGRCGADVVTGPVLPLFEEKDESLAWVERGRFFEPPRHAQGESLEKGFTGNILVRREILSRMDPPFDNRFGLKGAEDSHLFMRLRKEGCEIVWAADAVAHEFVPRSRMNLRWILARNFWGCSSHSLLERELDRSARVLAVRLVKGLLLLLVGLVELPPSLFLGKHRVGQSLVHVARGLGTISGALGMQGQWPR
jgi:succinoglycan biosynthesis protein ExoM